MNKICNIGINDYQGKVYINKRHIKSYGAWRNIIYRCYNNNNLKARPTYKDVKVCDEWLYFSNFKKWFDENYRFDLEEQGIKLELDKDLLSDNNKIYSPDTCIFLPSQINSFISDRTSNNKSGFVGVSWKKDYKKWAATIKIFGTNKYKHLGYFKDKQEAFETYKISKAIEIKKVKNFLKKLGYNEKIIEKIGG